MTVPRPRRPAMAQRLRRTADALERLVAGLGSAVVAIGTLIGVVVVAGLSLVGVGLPAVAPTAQVLRGVADRERRRLGLGPADAPVPSTARATFADPTTRRELGWLAAHATLGWLSGLVGLVLPLYALQSLTFPLWFRWVDAETGGPGPLVWPVRDLADALVVAALGPVWAVLSVLVLPGLARLQEWPARHLLRPAGSELALRVAELRATRAAALDAHAAELRRIERSLHDGTQNRLVAVSVLLGSARRAVLRDPTTAAGSLERAQSAAEAALAELRSVVRGILPPILDTEGLAGALDGLAAGCAVPCSLELDLPERCARAVEATAYFAVSEALTNVSRHSGATRARVTAARHGHALVVEVADDGLGGARDTTGSGLEGIRRRVEAHDGRLFLSSPPGGPTVLRVELPCGS
ncbi:sensor domain-containing protein [Phycicoccus sp. CSK15P-2]|uniref:sensor histidine kinase n=1 Tax=Phycicoccus sp. CSK15P-2 TaxID=2807627 RepID=UPI00195147F5|nr:sensor domain-containing protein [Phycicoccus sp. CSK15P-2]MBM6404534.1 sensor domain-containing protein [Phycicoccus sp. CSK15P-2]